MNGMARGYLKYSPFDALMLATMIQTISSTPRNKSIGIPTRMKQSGIARMTYRSTEIWKFIAALPFVSTHADPSFLEIQQMRGPIMPPNGKIKPAKAER